MAKYKIYAMIASPMMTVIELDHEPTEEEAAELTSGQTTPWEISDHGVVELSVAPAHTYRDSVYEIEKVED